MIYVYGLIYIYDIYIYIFSGPALGVVAGSRLPSYCVMSRTAAIASKLEKLGQGMKIHISEDSKILLDTVGGFRCDYRGTLELGVSERCELRQDN